MPKKKKESCFRSVFLYTGSQKTARIEKKRRKIHMEPHNISYSMNVKNMRYAKSAL